MPLTDFAENALLNVTLRNVAYTPPVTVYVALFTATPSDTGGGTEVTGGSYARQAASFVAPTAGATSNGAALTFTNLPAATITHAAIFDAATAGNMLYYGALTAARTVVAGDSLTIPIGDLDVTLD